MPKMSTPIKDDLDTLAKRLASARKELRLSQTEVAEIIKIDPSNYSRLESGKTKRSSHINAIANALQVNANWLMKKEGSRYLTKKDIKKTGISDGHSNADVEEDLDTLVKRLVSARKELGLSQTELAELINIDPSTYSRLEAGKFKGSSFMIEVANALHVQPDWLIEGEGERYSTPRVIKKIEVINKFNGVPILAWAIAGNFTDLKSIDKKYIIGEAPRPKDLSKFGFALKVPGQSMAPEFKPDEIIYVEPQTNFRKIEDSDLVIVKRSDDEEVAFKQLMRGESLNDIYLKILNPNWPDPKMVPKGKYKLVGKVVGKYVKY